MPRPKNFNKEEVLDKAKNLFWQKGFHATSMQDIVDHLGINRASIYDTYGGKEDLYAAALEAYRLEFAGHLDTILESDPSPRRALISFIEASIFGVVNDKSRKGCFLVNCTSEYLPTHGNILDELLASKEVFQSAIRKTILKGKRQGEFSQVDSPKQTASYLYTLLSGLNVVSRLKQDPKEIRKSLALGLKVLGN